MPNDLFPPEDQELLGQCLAQIQAGQPVSDQQMLDLCYARLRTLVNRQLRRYPELRGSLDPEDVMDGPGGALKSISGMLPRVYDGVDGLVRAASTVIKNKLRDLRKSRARITKNEERSLFDLQEGEMRAREEPNPLLNGISDLQEAIARLPEDDQRLIEYIYYAGLSQAETARQLGLGSDRAVRYRLQNIQQRLAAELADERLPGLLSDESSD